MNAITTTFVFASLLLASLLLLLGSYKKEEQERTAGHSDRLIRGKGWMLIDGEYLED